MGQSFLSVKIACFHQNITVVKFGPIIKAFHFVAKML